MEISKIDNYINESTTNKFGKLIGNYMSKLKMLQNRTIKEAEVFIKQIDDPEVLDDLTNMLDMGDEVQDTIGSIIYEKLDKMM